MKRSIAVLVASGLWLAALPQLGASADSCGAVTVLTDPQGDWDGDVVTDTGAPVAEGTPEEDLLSVSVASAGSGKLAFVIKVVSMPAVLEPNAAWFTSFLGPDQQTYYGVRMQTDQTGTPSYFSYTASGSGAGGTGPVDGRFINTQKPADAASGYTADGTITIIVNASDVGIAGTGDTLGSFDAASMQGAGDPSIASLAVTTDDAPAGLVRGDATYKEGDCGSKSGVLGLGALQLPALLILGGLAALRRRAR